MAKEAQEVTEEIKQEGDFKIPKKKPKKLGRPKEKINKVDLTKKEEETSDAISESGTGNVDETQSTTPVSEVVEEVRELPQDESTETTEETIKEESPIVEITQEEKEIPAEVVEEESTPEVPEVPQVNVPENLEKLVTFMEETGGTLQDYVRLNTDYSNFNNEELLKEYYKATRSSLNDDEIEFLLDEAFDWDEEEDDERTIRGKQVALKEEIAKAKGFLEDTKKKYYDEIKLRPSVTKDQQEAMTFYNTYSKEQQKNAERHSTFKKSTQDFFTNFEGFDFNLGEKSFKYKVKNVGEVATNQSDLNNFIRKFLNKKGEISDYKGYHKAMYSAKNADDLAHHFYEQGKTDAIKELTSKSKNIKSEPRTTGDITMGGYKIRAISGDDSSKLKIKTRNK